MLLARNVMTDRVVSLHPDTSWADAAEVLLEGGFSAVPVTDTGGHLVGVLSTVDLLRARVSDGVGPERICCGTPSTRTVSPMPTPWPLR